MFFKGIRDRRRRELEEWKLSMQNEKNNLSFWRGGLYYDTNNIHPNEYSLAYTLMDAEDYDALIPPVLDIIDELLNGYYVVTHINDNIYRKNLLEDMKKYPKDYKRTSQIPPTDDYAKNYSVFAEAHDLYSGNFFFDGSASFAIVTRDANISALKAFYNTLHGYTYLDNHIYGFSVDPFETICDSYSDISEFLMKNEYDILFNYSNQHVVLSIQINPKTVSENKILETVRNVCEKYGKKLEICL